MATDRKFAAFNNDKSIATGKEDLPSFCMKQVPDGGFCLSSFLVLSPENNQNKVLLGRLNPAAAWDHLGALEDQRVQMHSKGWMLPSSHLIIRESPQEAATRIMKEQLEIEDTSRVMLSEPKVGSEVYLSPRFPGLPPHWDIEFIFRGTYAGREAPASEAWTDLKFVDIGKIPRSQMARSHEDILQSIGFRFAT